MAIDSYSGLVLSLMNNSEDGIIAFDQHLRVTEVNAVIERWSKRSSQEIMGEHFFHAFPSYKPTEKSEEGREIQNKVLNGEKVNIPERPFSQREGFCEIEIMPLLNSDGKFTGGVCFVHETTERRKAEVDLRESHTLLRKVADTSPSILFVYDLEQKRNIFINRTIKHVLGYEVDEFGELIEDIYNSLFHPEDVEKGILHIEQMKKLRDGEVLEVEYRMKDSKGQWHWFRSLDTVFKRNENGEVIQMLGNAQDITKEKEAQDIILNKNEELTSLLEELRITERKLRESNEELEQRVVQRTTELVESEKEVKRREEQLRSIGDAMPVFIAFMRSDNTFDFVNKAYEGFFHIKREEIIGKHVREIIGEESFKDQEEYFERCLKGETVKFESKLEYFGSSKWFNITFIPKKIDREVVGKYVLVEDVTEFKEIQLELEALLKQLESANEEKGAALQELEGKNNTLQKINNDLDNFVYVASHDLRSPVNNIEGLLELLKGKLLEKADSKDVQVFNMMELATSRLKKTIGDLFEVIRKQKEDNGIVPKESLVRFHEVTKEVKEDIHNLILKNHATIVEDFKVEETYYRRSNLRSIVYNLLSNAVKYYSPERPLLVEIETYLEGEYIVLAVKDNGLGLTNDELRKLFNLFERMHQHVEGTGVGLYSIKRIVEANGGRIVVKSEEGVGTEFIVFLTKKEIKLAD